MTAGAEMKMKMRQLCNSWEFRVRVLASNIIFFWWRIFRRDNIYTILCTRAVKINTQHIILALWYSL